MTETPDRVSVEPYSDLIDRLTLYEHREGYDGKDWEKIASEAADAIRALSAAPRPTGEGVALSDMREIATGRGYESVLEALEDLDRLRAPPAPSADSGVRENLIGAAEVEVGQAVYQRIEALMDCNPEPGTPKWAELDYLSDLVSSVEEYGSYDGPRQALAQPAPQEDFSPNRKGDLPTDGHGAAVLESGDPVVGPVQMVSVRFGDIQVNAPMPGFRHHHILTVASYFGHRHGEQGFATADGSFLTRTEAAELALASGQVAKLIAGPDLYSEDIW